MANAHFSRTTSLGFQVFPTTVFAQKSGRMHKATKRT
jgi:hypothetical protein